MDDEAIEKESGLLNEVTNAVMAAVEEGVPPTVVRETVEDAITTAGGGA